jgi:hypothetical protein
MFGLFLFLKEVLIDNIVYPFTEYLILFSLFEAVEWIYDIRVLSQFPMFLGKLEPCAQGKVKHSPFGFVFLKLIDPGVILFHGEIDYLLANGVNSVCKLWRRMIDCEIFTQTTRPESIW